VSDTLASVGLVLLVVVKVGVLGVEVIVVELGIDRRVVGGGIVGVGDTTVGELADNHHVVGVPVLLLVVGLGPELDVHTAVRDGDVFGFHALNGEVEVVTDDVVVVADLLGDGTAGGVDDLEGWSRRIPWRWGLGRCTGGTASSSGGATKDRSSRWCGSSGLPPCIRRGRTRRG